MSYTVDVGNEHKRFFENTTLTVTPTDPYGQYRFLGKVICVEVLGDFLKLTLRVSRTIDMRWSQNQGGETIYFSLQEKIWSLSPNISPQTELMVEMGGFSYLEYHDEYEKYGLFVSGEDVRRVLLKKFSLTRYLANGEKKINLPIPSNQNDFSKGAEFRTFLVQVLDEWKECFSKEEAEMCRTYLSYYKQF